MLEVLDRIVISNIKGIPYKKLIKGKLLSPANNGIGYLQVGLKGGTKKYVHILVAESFVEKPNDEKFYEVNHIDHDKSNNNYSNLEWVSKKRKSRKKE